MAFSEIELARIEKAVGGLCRRRNRPEFKDELSLEYRALRSWKGYDWDIMNRLHEKGLISNPHGRAKSVLFTEEGEREADVLLARLLGVPVSSAPAKDRRKR